MIEIENSKALTDLFGHWPDFHDAELLTLRLDTTSAEGASLEAEFEVAEMGEETDERGYYRDRQRARARLRFARLARLQLTDFLHQNVLWSLELTEAGAEDFDPLLGDHPDGRRRYRIRWDSSVGCAADFLCDRLAVVEAVPVARAT